MHLPRSTYYEARASKPDETPIVATIVTITDEFELYGYRRVTAELRARGLVVNAKKVRRLMRENGLNPKRRRRFVATTDSDHAGPIFPNLAKDTTADGPNRLWVADITYVTIATGFVYLAVILDAWSRKVVGYALSRRIDARLAVAALKVAIQGRDPPPGCVHHSDRGSQYASEAYRELLHEHGLVGSMGRRGNPYDNAKAESFMKTLKVEAGLPHGLREFPGRGGGRSPLHRRSLQRPTAPLGPRLCEPQPVRGQSRPADGQNRSLTLSGPRGALHSLAIPGRAWPHHIARRRRASFENERSGAYCAMWALQRCEGRCHEDRRDGVRLDHHRRQDLRTRRGRSALG
jgi:putative transposase